MVSKTPENVARLATQSDALSSGQLVLIGLFGPDDALTAMVRLPSGRIRQVKVGSNLASGRVVAIDHKGLVIERRGTTVRLSVLTQ